MNTLKHRPSTYPSPFGDLMQEFLGNDIAQVFGSNETKRSMPVVNIVERKQEFEIQLLAPGYSKQDLKLSMEKDQLTINAEKKESSLEADERYTRREFAQHGFSRRFKLPETVDSAGIEASFNDGVLKVRVPKAEISIPKTREIGIN